jgi:uncharacterized membrane protein (DUF4010 family)
VIAGILGGLVSSTAVTLAFSRASREKDAPTRALALGVIGACTTLIPRVVVLCLVLQPVLAPRVMAYLALPFMLGLVLLAVSLLRRTGEADPARPATAARSGSARRYCWRWASSSR